jgi:hypothetical protein
MSAVPVTLHVPDGWDFLDLAEQKRVHERTAAYLEDLFDGIELPVDPSIDIEEDPSLKTHTVAVTVGRRASRVFVGGTQWEHADDVLSGLTRAAFRGRCLFLTDKVIDRVWSAWANGDRVRERALRRWLLAETVRLGARVSDLERAVAGRRDRITDAAGARKLFEDALTAKGHASMRLSPELYSRCIDADTGKLRRSDATLEFAEGLSVTANALFRERGLRLSSGGARMCTICPSHGFQIVLNDMPLPPVRGLLPDQFLVDATVDQLQRAGTKGQPAVNPVTGRPAAVASGADARQACKGAGYATWGPEGYLVLHLGAAVLDNPGAVITRATWLYEHLQLFGSVPIVMKGLNREDWENVRVLRALAEEGLSIRDRLGILETISAPVEAFDADVSKHVIYYPTGYRGVAPTRDRIDGGTDDLTERVRVSLKRYVSHTMAEGGNKLVAYLVHHDVERRIQAIDPTRFVDGDGQEFCDLARKELGDLTFATPRPILLTDLRTRRRLRLVLALEFPHVPVISYNELMPDIDIQPIARIQ